MSEPRTVTDPARVSRVRATHLTAHASGGWSSTGLLIEHAGHWSRVATRDGRLFVWLDGVITEVDPVTTARLLAAELDRLLTDAGITTAPHPYDQGRRPS